MRGHLWSPKDARAAIQEWYDTLKDAYNRGDAAQIRKLYNDDSLLYARRSGKPYKGKSAIKKFWLDFLKPRRGLMTSVEITVTTLVPTNKLVGGDPAFHAVFQEVHWTGRMAFEKKSRKAGRSTLDFIGLGDHLEVCMFNNPGYEDYPA